MKDQAWIQGMGRLSLGFRSRDEEQEHIQARAGLYREMLDDLSDESFLWAVNQIIKLDQWFPTVARIRQVAEEWRPQVHGYLPEPRRTEEEKEADRQRAKIWLEKIKAQAEGREALVRESDEMFGPGESPDAEA